jgi:hypothetical protein
VRRRRLAALAFVLTLSCASGAASPASCTSFIVRFGEGRSLDVRLAADDADRTRGLHGVADLGANEGMAFLWDAPSDGPFWMKDMLIPLSIAFVDAEGRIVTILEMTPCEADPCPTYRANGPYTMAIEANIGWFAEHGVQVGDEVELRGRRCS